MNNFNFERDIATFLEEIATIGAAETASKDAHVNKMPEESNQLHDDYFVSLWKRKLNQINGECQNDRGKCIRLWRCGFVSILVSLARHEPLALHTIRLICLLIEAHDDRVYHDDLAKHHYDTCVAELLPTIVDFVFEYPNKWVIAYALCTLSSLINSSNRYHRAAMIAPIESNKFVRRLIQVIHAYEIDATGALYASRIVSHLSQYSGDLELRQNLRAYTHPLVSRLLNRDQPHDSSCSHKFENYTKNAVQSSPVGCFYCLPIKITFCLFVTMLVYLWLS